MAIVTLPSRFYNAPNRGSDVDQDMIDLYNIVQDINNNAVPTNGGLVYAKSYGVVANGVTDDTAAMQLMINYLVANGGGIGILPPGFIMLSSPLTITAGIILQGGGIGGGSGAGNSGGTILRSNSSAGDVITISCAQSVGLRDFTIDCPSYTKAIGTCGIRLQGAGGAGNVGRRARFQNLRILNMYDGIVFDSFSDTIIRDCHIQDYLNYGINYRQTGGTDSGQTTFDGLIIWDLNVGSSTACFYYAKGGDVRITNTKLLGSNYGVWLNLDAGPTGTLQISSNSFEQQRTNCFYASQASITAAFGNLILSTNEFSIVGLNAQSAIYIAAGTAPATYSSWMNNFVIGQNVFNMANAHAYPTISVHDGVAGIIEANSINNAGKTGPVGIDVGGNTVSCIVGYNEIINTPSGSYSSSTYPFMTSDTVTFSPATAGSINNYAIGGVTPLAGAFTSLSATGALQLSGTLRKGQGNTVSQTIGNLSNQGLQFLGGGESRMISGRYSNDTSGGALYFAKSRNTSPGSFTAVTTGDNVGTLSCYADDGTTLNSQVASIQMNVEGTVGTGITPGNIILSTTAAGAGSVTQRVKIDSAGLCAITGTATVSGGFGCNTKSAQTAYASGGALNAYGAGGNGFDTAGNASALYAMVVAIRAALVANGIMS